MLRKLLQLLADQKVVSLEELSRQLELEPSTIKALLQELARLEYLAPASPDCEKRCSNCPLAGSCLPFSELWTLTPKGWQTLKE